MNYEIEVKAWVDDTESLARILGEKAEFQREYVKQDRYFRFASGQPDARIRTDDGKSFLTWKEKNIEKGMEFNREHETLIEDAEVVEALLLRLGGRLLVEKHKAGSAWTMGRALVEFSAIRGLGNFVEIEICLSPESSTSEQDQAAAEIATILESLGIPAGRIESRPYTQMLAENGRSDFPNIRDY